MGIEMIICPNCHHQEYAGALFCSECAAQLIVTDHRYMVGETDLIGDEETGVGFTRKRRVSTRIGHGDTIYLKSLRESAILELSGRKEFTIGRGVKGQLILPDVDLERYNALELGVSRLHAVLKVTDISVAIMDLGSSNGTFINGEQIEDHQEKTVNHGDIIALGKLELEVLFDM